MSTPNNSLYTSPSAATPNGQVTANQGALYEYTGGGIPALWTKTTNGGNTGWVPFQAVSSGTTSNRPTGVPAGWQYFDTTIGKPVWLQSGNNWVDASGATTTQNRDPSSISGLVARYRADSISGVTDGSAVSSWPDTSGSGYTAITASGGTAPTYRSTSVGGKPAVRFTGSQALDSALPAHTSAQTIIFVASVANNVIGTVRGTVGGNGLMLRTYNGTPQLLVQETANIGAASAPLGNGIASVVISTYDSVSGAYSFTTNGATAGTGTSTQSLTASTTRIGQNGASGKTDFFSGDIAELLVWNRILTSTERITVDSYVQDRYSITVSDYLP